MAAMSDYLEKQLINHIFRSTAYGQPLNISIALCTDAPVDSDTGDLTGKEVSALDYVRISLSPLDTNWSDVTVDGTTFNLIAITWPAAASNWGTIGWVAIVDNSTIGNGNLLFHGAIDNPQAVDVGGVFQFSINQLGIQIDN